MAATDKTYRDRVLEFNAWYESLPEMWRFQVIVWGLVVLGAINMVLTIWARFPFAMLVVAGIMIFAALRVPYIVGWIRPAAGTPARPPAKIELSGDGWDWARRVNVWYDNESENNQRIVVILVLLVSGLLNMWMTIESRFPFGLLFLLVCLGMIAIRVPYRMGWLKPKAAAPAVAAPAPSPTIAAPAVQVEAAPKPAPKPAVARPMPPPPPPQSPPSPEERP
jgi:hypothetical protein